MAVEKTITQSAEIFGAPFGMPRVDIPGNADVVKRDRIHFTLNTAAAPVRVESWGTSHWVCRGTVAALVAAGLLRPEWCPGIPGNGKSRQAVLFDSTGPGLLVGGHKGRRLKEAHITVCRYSARAFSVEIPMTPEQVEQVEQLRNQWRAGRDAKEEKDRWAEYEKKREQGRRAMTQHAFREMSESMLTTCEGVLLAVQKESRFRYADDVTAQVNQHLQAARQLLLTGKILPVSLEYQRDGNVVFFPGVP